MGSEATAPAVHVLLVPYPAQGHVNPMLQFGKRLASQGHPVTMALPRSLLRTKPHSPTPASANISVEEISDGYDDGGVTAAPSIGAYLDRFRVVGSMTLASLVGRLGALGEPVNCITYDPFLAWSLDVAKALGLPGAAFITQAATVCALYCRVRGGELDVPLQGPLRAVEDAPEMELGDAPSFLTTGATQYPAYLEMVINQFNNVNEADAVLINSFYELEPQMLDWLGKTWPVMTRAIGPVVPSAYLDNRIHGDGQYGLDLFTHPGCPCLSWLDTKPPGSVVYVSFGSMSKMGKAQTEELARGLKTSGKSFLWVVKNWDACHLPEDAAAEDDRGLVVSWSPQLRVLAHGAVGCFVTHCGWNSTLEALSLGVPVVAMPQWTDQPSNAWLMEKVWGVGVRARSNDEGVVGREEIQRCVEEVIEMGPRREEVRQNARRWCDEAVRAVSVSGSSDKGIQDFVDLVRSKK